MANRVSTQFFRSVDWAICKTAGFTFNTIQHFNKKNPNPIRCVPRALKKRAKPSSPARKTGAI
jgi:hypothetical protein